MTVTDSAWRLPAVLLALQTLVLIVLTGALTVAGVSGGTDSSGRALTEAATVLALAVCSGLLAVGFWRRRSVVRTPSLLWNTLAAIVGITVATSGAPGVGVAITVAGVATFLASLRVPRYDLHDDE